MFSCLRSSVAACGKDGCIKLWDLRSQGLSGLSASIANYGSVGMVKKANTFDVFLGFSHGKFAQDSQLRGWV